MKTKPIPIRLDADTQRRIRNCAVSLGGNSSTVIRLAILNQLPEIESGHLTLPRRSANEAPPRPA